MLSLLRWGDRWAAAEPSVAFVHTYGEELDLVHTCRACGGEVSGRDLKARLLPTSGNAAA